MVKRDVSFHLTEMIQNMFTYSEIVAFCNEKVVRTINFFGEKVSARPWCFKIPIHVNSLTTMQPLNDNFRYNDCGFSHYLIISPNSTKFIMVMGGVELYCVKTIIDNSREVYKINFF